MNNCRKLLIQFYNIEILNKHAMSVSANVSGLQSVLYCFVRVKSGINHCITSVKENLFILVRNIGISTIVTSSC